jgi:predicted enzyme related to lactoylglutathione lyase
MGSAMHEHEKINYVEFPATSLEATKAFFQIVFGWSFVDYGPTYAAFSGQGLDGGFFTSALAASVDKGSALIVFYSDHLEETQSKIEKAGGRIVKPIVPFPGGRRFHFAEPSGNEFAVWSEPGG